MNNGRIRPVVVYVMANLSHQTWLYVDTYTTLRPVDIPPSDALGYGLTSSTAIRQELTERGIRLIRPDVPVRRPNENPPDRAEWTSTIYSAVLSAARRARPDVIFFFHIFAVFPSVVRKLLQDIGWKVPMVGYTHGSHWDPTDLYRFENYPELELADLANLYVLDRLLVVSNYMRYTLHENIALLSPGIAAKIDQKTSVTGLALDVEGIQLCRPPEKYSRPTIVFNHAPSSAKRPEMFMDAMSRIMGEHDVNVLVTRRFKKGDPGEIELRDLLRLYPDRVILGNDLTIPDYYSALWKSDIQISTATHESLGVATLEAMATDNCCLLPKVGAYPEVVRGDEDVLYSGTTNELTSRLHYLLEHPHERKRIAQRLQLVATGYAPQPVVDRILAAVERL